MAALIRQRRVRGLLLVSLVAVDAVAAFVVPELSAPRAVQVDGAPIAFLSSHLGTARFATTGPITPNYGSYWGFGAIDAEGAPLPSTYTAYFRHRLNPAGDPAGIYTPTPPSELLSHLAGFRAAGVRYVLAPPWRPLPPAPGSLTLVLSPLLLVSLLLSVVLAAFIASDGESTWLEGASLVVLYGIIATAFWWG